MSSSFFRASKHKCCKPDNPSPKSPYIYMGYYKLFPNGRFISVYGIGFPTFVGHVLPWHGARRPAKGWRSSSSWMARLIWIFFMHTCKYIYIYVCVLFMYNYLYVYIHTYIHTYVHTYMCACPPLIKHCNVESLNWMED